MKTHDQKVLLLRGPGMVHLAVGMSRSVGNVSDLFRMETEIMLHCSHVRTY